MRKLLLNPTPLFRKLRQLSLLLSLLLVPFSAWGQDFVWPSAPEARYYDVSRFTTSVENGETTVTGHCISGTELSFKLQDSNGHDATATYSSSNTAVARLNTNTYTNNIEELEIVGAGTTVITATLNGNYTPQTYSYTLVITEIDTYYNIEVWGTEVSSGNCDDILKDQGFEGRITYDATNNILTFDNADIQDYQELGAVKFSIENLNVRLIGENHIDNGFEYNGSGTGTVTFLSDGGEANCLIFDNLDNTADISYRFDNCTITNEFNGTNEWKLALKTVNEYAQYVYIYRLNTYGITIAGTPVTSANASAITGTGISGTVSYDVTTNTLTLNGATISGKIESGLDALTIEFIGANELTGTSGYITSTNNSAPLTLKGVTNSTATTSTLSLNNSVGVTAISGFASATYDGAYLTASRAARYVSGTDAGIKDIEGGIVQLVTITTTPHYPLWVKSTQVTPDNKNNVLGDQGEATVSFDYDSRVLTLNGANFSNSNAIESNLDYLIIKLKGDNSVTTYIYGHSVICSGVETATLTIAKDATATGEVTLSMAAGGNPLPPVIRGFASVSLTGLNFASKTGSTIGATTTTDAVLTSATIYPLWVGGTLVTGARTSGTDATTSNIVWEYDAASNKLTLTNYNKTDNDGHAFISNMANLNVHLVGNNSVSPNSQISTDKAFYTTYTDATLTFSTDESNMGTLNASGYDIFCEGFRTVNGIYCNNGLGYYPGTREIKAKATPTIKFAKRDQGTGDEISPTEYVGADETIQTAIGYVFKAPNPTFDNGYEIFPDSTRYVYSYSVDGVVEFPTTGTNTNNPTRTDYGEINLLKAGTVTITCTFPGNMQNNPCSASYTLQIDKGNANLAYNATTSNAYIDLSGNGQWGVPNGAGGAAPVLTKPTNVTAITYTSSNTNVATVSSTGDVTPIGAGETTITATLSNDDNYNNTSTSYDLTVMVPATISFANATASMLNTGTYTQTATTVPTGSTITYSSSNNNVNVDANGQVTISNPSFYGPVTITATVTAVPAANPQLYYVLANEPAFQATYTLNVAKNFDISSIFTDASMNYATCILSEQLTKPDGLKVYYITGTNGNTVTTQEIDYLPYGIPILLEKTAATIGSVTARTDSSSVVSGNILQYATSNVNTTGSQYILYKNEFVKATGTILSGKCYLQITTNLPTRGVLGIGNDGSTAIEGIDVEATEDEEWYDLQGRRIQKPTKAGIYIKNGKKIVVNNK